VYAMLRQEVSDQENIEMAVSADINSLANKSNLLLRSRLNSNKSDFDRLRNLGAIGE